MICIKAAKKARPELEKKSEKLASEETDSFMKCTSSSFDGNVLKILNELKILH